MYDKSYLCNLIYAQKSTEDICRLVGCHRSTVFRMKLKIAVGNTSRKPGSGRPRSARTAALITSIKNKIAWNPIRSMRKMAKQANVSPSTIRRVVKLDLGAKSRSRTKRHLITKRIKSLRLQRCKKLLNKLKKEKHVILFTDEKIFTIDAVSNSRTDRYISSQKTSDIPDNVRFSFRTKHPANVMVFGLVASDGKKMEPVFVPCGSKMNADIYKSILEDKVLPWIYKNYANEDFPVFQQDGAPSHTANKTQNWLKMKMPGFIPKHLWPPSSPDLNPLDYSIWAFVQAEACAYPHSNIESLKLAIRKAWVNMTEDYIRTTCGRFRHRLGSVIAAEGNHID